MGEVYRAHDARLVRDVAIKVLHADVATDAERLRRFELEARAVAPGGVLSWGQFDVAPDGQRFLMVVPSTDAPQPVNVILNWQSLLTK